MADLTGQEGPERPQGKGNGMGKGDGGKGEGNGRSPGDGSGHRDWGEIVVSEGEIAALVLEFYTAARADALLAPIFSKTVNDWDSHLVLVQDFWSHVLLGTTRYKGHPFPIHMHLPIEPEHFDRWLALFLVAADATLPEKAAARAKARAKHMTESFRVGLFPFVGADGRPSRLPPRASV